MKEIRNGKNENGPASREEVQLALLSCSPMAKLEENTEQEALGETNLGEAVSFCAETHAQHIKSMFAFYNIDVLLWAVCQIADNCKVNMKVASLLGIPHVACKSHLLNLEVNHMVKNTRDLEVTLASVHETMLQCKHRLRNAALLRNLIDLRPVLHNVTRWSGKLYMLERFLRIRDELIEISQDEHSNLTVNSSQAFKNKVQRYCKQLAQIDLTTKELQTRKISMSHCQYALDLLVDDVCTGSNDSDSPFFLCFLKNSCIASDAEILHDPCFESGVCKIQDDRTAAMTHAERLACERLLLPVEDSESDDGILSSSVQEYKQRLHRRKRRKIRSETRYMNCDFVLGSVAEVERLWSMADQILSDNRMRTSPQLFEAIIFLRANERFWDVHLVQEAFALSMNDNEGIH